MKSELLSQEKNVVTIKVTVDKAEFANQLNATYKQVAKQVNIPGFRKGKAPRAVLEMRLGKEAMKAQALDDMLPKTLEDVCAEYDLEPIAQPKIEDLSMEDDQDLVFNVKYEVEPEVALPALGEIFVDLPVIDVTDEMVNDSLASYKKRFANYEVAARASKQGDKVRAAYSMTVHDEEGKTIVSHEPQIETFELDPMTLRSEILEALLGVEAGAKKETEIKIAEDYPDKNVAGKLARYDFDVIEVQEPVAPEMDDDFFKKVTKADVHSEEELRAQLRADIDKNLKDEARRTAENAAVAKIVEGAKVELPDSMVERQKNSLRSRFEENVKMRTNKTLEEYYQSEGHDMKEFEENLEKDARRDVLNFLVVDACAKSLNVVVQKADLDAEIEQMAAQYGISADSVRDILQKRPEDLENMYSSARYRKTMQAIMAQVKVNEVKKTSDTSDTSETPAVKVEAEA